MFGFYPFEGGAFGDTGTGLGAVVITVTPLSAVGMVGQPSPPYTVTVSGPFNDSIFIQSSLGSLITPQTLTGSGTFRVTPLITGTDYITFTNGGGATNPSPVTLNVGIAPVPPTPIPTRVIQGFIKDEAGVIRPNLTGLDWAWFDQFLPSTLGSPKDQGSSARTDARGFLTLTVRSDLDIGDVGYLILSDTTGVPSEQPPEQAFAGPVATSA